MKNNMNRKLDQANKNKIDNQENNNGEPKS